jgi:hypothetical protein
MASRIDKIETKVDQLIFRIKLLYWLIGVLIAIGIIQLFI